MITLQYHDEWQIAAEHAGQRFDVVLAQHLQEHSRARLTEWIKAGQVLLNGIVVKPNKKIEGGEWVVVDVTIESAVSHEPESMDLQVVYEDHAIVVLNKAAGRVVHPGAGNRAGTLLNGLLFHAPECIDLPRAGIVHRLDKDTTGLMVVAKTLEAQTSLVRQLSDRSVKRIYWALVFGDVVGSGTIDEPIGRHPKERTKMAVVPTGKESRTHYRVLKRYAGLCTLLECKLETGRTHQIRVHCAHKGHPLVGDGLYNPRCQIPKGDASTRMLLKDFPRQALHAMQLSFIHPETQELLNFEAKLPEDFEGLLRALESK